MKTCTKCKKEVTEGLCQHDTGFLQYVLCNACCRILIQYLVAHELIGDIKIKKFLDDTTFKVVKEQEKTSPD